MRILAVVASLAIVQAATPSERAAGVLVGVHRSVDYAMQSGAGRQPPAGGALRTIWISAGAEPVVPIEVPDLLLPRRTGFWRLGLLGSCAEEPHKTADDQIDGVETVFGDDLWAAPLGMKPEVRIESANWLGVPVRVGPCQSPEVYCSVDQRIWIQWIWPEYVSLNRGTDSGCGAHPDGSLGYTVERIDRLGGELTIGEVLGRAVERRFERALTAAVKASDECWEQARFQPASWRIFRVPGGWKPEGWSDTHRLCGYGVDFTVNVDLSRITGRKPDQARWLALKHRMPQLTDAHFSPDGRWIVATTDSELLFLDSAAPDRAAARIPLSVSDSVVMVEWATGANIARWNTVVQRTRAEGAVTPVVLR